VDSNEKVTAGAHFDGKDTLANAANDQGYITSARPTSPALAAQSGLVF